MTDSSRLNPGDDYRSATGGGHTLFVSTDDQGVVGEAKAVRLTPLACVYAHGYYRFSIQGGERVLADQALPRTKVLDLFFKCFSDRCLELNYQK